MTRERTRRGSWNCGRGAWALIALGSTICLGLGGCLGDEDPDQAGMSQAAVQETDVCLPSDLDFTSSAQTCAGPWTYKAYDKQTSPFNLCACQTHKTCTREVEQPDYHNNSKTVTVPGINTTVLKRSVNRDLKSWIISIPCEIPAPKS